MTGRATSNRVSGYVQLIRGGAGGFFGVCMRCGPLPHDRATRQEAQRDVDDHCEVCPRG
jgi:hypothetical protein